MSDTAVHLEQEVLPREPIRHWVCSFPWGVRSVLGYDRELCRDAAAAFAQELSRSLKRRAKVLLPLPCLSDALTGSICVVQRTDGALRLNVHLHVLALDGVYTEAADGTLSFHALPTPTAAEVSAIAERTAKRLHEAFQKEGRVSPWDDAAAPVDAELTDSLQDAQPGLFACYQAAAGGIAVSGERACKPLLRLMLSPGAMTDKPSNPEPPEQPIATALGVNLYAKQLVDGRDRATGASLSLRDAAAAVSRATRVARRRAAAAHAQKCLEGWHACFDAGAPRPAGSALCRDSASLVQHGAPLRRLVEPFQTP